MKGITPIIAVILLVFMTIALSAVATDSLVGNSEKSAEKARENLEDVQQRTTKRFEILDVKQSGNDVEVLIRNRAYNEKIEKGDITIIIDNEIKECEEIGIGKIIVCEVDGVADSCGKDVVIVSGPAGSAKYDC